MTGAFLGCQRGREELGGELPGCDGEDDAVWLAEDHGGDCGIVAGWEAAFDGVDVPSHPLQQLHAPVDVEFAPAIFGRGLELHCGVDVGAGGFEEGGGFEDQLAAGGDGGAFPCWEGGGCGCDGGRGVGGGRRSAVPDYLPCTRVVDGEGFGPGDGLGVD